MVDNKEILKLKDLSIGYKGEVLISNISVCCNQPSLIVLLGANGQGKSTLLRVLNNHLDQLEGDVIINGKSTIGLISNELAKKVAFLPSTSSFPIEVTVMDLLEYARIPYLNGFKGLSRDDKEIIEHVVKRLNLKEWLSKSYMSLSDGQKQLVNIGRALVQDTSVILLDEPTAHLDIVNKARVFQELKNQSQLGKLIICSSHDLYEAYPIADEFWIIDSERNFKSIAKSDKSLEELKAMLF